MPRAKKKVAKKPDLKGAATKAVSNGKAKKVSKKPQASKKGTRKATKEEEAKYGKGVLMTTDPNKKPQPVK